MQRGQKRVSQQYEDNLTKNLGEIISRFRQRKYLTVAQMGELCGLSALSIQRMEEGVPVRLTVAGFARLAAVLHLTLERLTGQVRGKLSGSQAEKRYLKEQKDRVNKRIQENMDREERIAARQKRMKERKERAARQKEMKKRKEIQRRRFQEKERKRLHKLKQVWQAAEARRRPERSIVTTEPWMIDWWDKKGNAGLTPLNIKRRNTRILHWRCPESRDHKFATSAFKLATSKKKCPFCAGTRSCRTNNLAALYPEVAWDFHSEKHGFGPDEVVALPNKTNRIYWWQCRHCGFEWSEKLSARISGSPCPSCNWQEGQA